MTYLETRSVARLVRDGIPADLAARVAALHGLVWGARVHPHRGAVFVDVDDQSNRKGWITIRLGTNPEACAVERAIIARATGADA